MTYLCGTRKEDLLTAATYLQNTRKEANQGNVGVVDFAASQYYVYGGVSWHATNFWRFQGLTYYPFERWSEYLLTFPASAVGKVMTVTMKGITFDRYNPYPPAEPIAINLKTDISGPPYVLYSSNSSPVTYTNWGDTFSHTATLNRAYGRLRIYSVCDILYDIEITSIIVDGVDYLVQGTFVHGTRKEA